MPQIRERERALFAVVFVVVLKVSLSSILSFLSLSQRNAKREQLCLAPSLSCVINTREYERERGDCVGIPWCWKSGFDEDDEDEDFVGDEKESRDAVDDDDATSFVVFALVFVRSRDSTDG